MEKLILDYSKWRCGVDGDNKLGEGDTALLNSEGYLCCLGQFSLQLNKALTEKNIRGMGKPEEIGKEIPLLVQENYNYNKNSLFDETELTEFAIDINDDPTTSSEEKISQLKELFLKQNYEIEVINKP